MTITHQTEIFQTDRADGWVTAGDIRSLLTEDLETLLEVVAVELKERRPSLIDGIIEELQK